MMNKNYWWKPLLYRKIDGLKKKIAHVTIRPVSAYDPNDFEQFLFEGWISLPINNKQIYFKRHKDPSYPWYDFSWKDIIRNNWKYIGPVKKNFILNYWYIAKFDFTNKIITVTDLIK